MIFLPWKLKLERGNKLSKFIALEGLHGVGKSTVAELIAQRVGVVVTPTIPEEFSSARKLVNSGFSIESRYMLFLSATLSTGERVEQMIKNGMDVVVESYIFRSIAFHEGMGSKIKIGVLGKELFLPTHTILLTCDPQIRTQRIKDRGGIRNRWDALAESKSDQISLRYAAFGFPEIDTTWLQPQQVADRIMEMVNGNSQ